MKLENNKFHKSFKLNSFSFSSVDELITFTSDFSDKHIHQFLKDWFSKDDFIIVKTSGSTGKPKHIQLKKEQMINSAFATGTFFNLKENTTALLCLPVEYIAGKMMLVRAINLGWHIDIVESNLNPLKNVNKEYDFSALVPLQLENSISKLHLIKKLIAGGGVVSKTLENKIQNIATDIFATYGMTETITHIAVKRLNNYIEKPIFYQTLPNVTIYKDTRNCLVIDAPNVSKEIIFTNDVVDLIADNQFHWLGRFDNVINSGGIKLHPEKIEEKLSEIISNRFFVAGIPDEKLGQKLILIIENVNSYGVGKSLENNIKNLTTLSKYEAPKEIYFLSEFIETETKKIQRSKTLDLIKF